MHPYPSFDKTSALSQHMVQYVIAPLLSSDNYYNNAGFEMTEIRVQGREKNGATIRSVEDSIHP